LSSREDYTLVPVECGKPPERKVDALAFALALRESRKLSENASFHDSIYVEQYSRLLPTWTLTPRVEDEVVLGTWIAGGVVISAKSFRRLCSLAGWVSPEDLLEIVAAAGFQAPTFSGVLARQKGPPRQSRDIDSASADATIQLGECLPPQVAVSDRTFSLPGRPKLEEFFNDYVVDIVLKPDRYQAMGIEFPAPIVLHGPPGCGKTFAVERLVEFLDWPSFSIDSESVGSPYIHETSRKISEVFTKAIDSAPSVIVIDEMESFLSDRRSAGVSGLHHVEEVAEFIRRIPEACSKKVLVVGMTNLIDTIDPAILRRGRFDHVVEVGMPSRSEVASLLDFLLMRLPKSEGLNLEAALDTLTGRPLSDSAFFVREAARLAAKSGKTQLDQESMAAALGMVCVSNEKRVRHVGFAREA
jgi:hypothetical protein